MNSQEMQDKEELGKDNNVDNSFLPDSKISERPWTISVATTIVKSSIVVALADV